jgi:hypothetical protein
MLDSMYTDGEPAFFERLSKTLRYPAAARTNGVMGLSAVSFKVDCNNKPHAFIFTTKMGFGIEDELQKTLVKSVDNWIECNKRDTSQRINLKVAFSINKLYRGEYADLVFNAMGNFPGVSDEQLKKDLEKALEKNQREKAQAALTKLVMRFPYNQEYRKKLLELFK